MWVDCTLTPSQERCTFTFDCCRVDMEGNTNDVHDIHLRAMKAAEIINMRHGWEQPQEIRNMRKVELAEDSENTLKDMQQFNIDRYFNSVAHERL